MLSFLMFIPKKLLVFIVSEINKQTNKTKSHLLKRVLHIPLLSQYYAFHFVSVSFNVVDAAAQRSLALSCMILEIYLLLLVRDFLLSISFFLM